MIAQNLRPDARQRNLSHRGRRLALLQLQWAARQLETPAAECDGAGGDDQQLAAFAMELGNVGRQRRQPLGAHVAGLGIDQKRRADLDDDAAEILELRAAGHGSFEVKRRIATAIRATFAIWKWRGAVTASAARSLQPVHGSASAARLALVVTGFSPITSASARRASLTPAPVAPETSSGVFFA